MLSSLLKNPLSNGTFGWPDSEKFEQLHVKLSYRYVYHNHILYFTFSKNRWVGFIDQIFIYQCTITGVKQVFKLPSSHDEPIQNKVRLFIPFV